MPFDGVVCKCIVEELKNKIIDGRIEKVFQPEKDEVIIFIRAKGENQKLLLSANPSFPRIHLTSIQKQNPSVPPVFCMLMRKHLCGGKILDVQFHDFERIISLNIESTNELGDICVKKLVIEIMGKHSNIILLNNEDRIIDAIKHIDQGISSVREIMPARHYSLPPSQDKISPISIEPCKLIDKLISDKNMGNLSVEKALLSTIRGFSPLLCREICHTSGLEPKTIIGDVSIEQRDMLSNSLAKILQKIKNSKFNPCILLNDDVQKQPADFHCIKIYHHPYLLFKDSINDLLDFFYSSRDLEERLKQKKSSLMKSISNSIERCSRKLAVQQESIRDVADREKLKLYGELILANIYSIKPGDKEATVLNYYSENSQDYITIPLDENLTPQLNAQKYFKQYAKAKNTYAYASSQLEETLKELDYLESVQLNLENARTMEEIEEIKAELVSQGYMHESTASGKNSKKQSKSLDPIKYISDDGFEILVGRNNMQNDILTLKIASSNDIWLHTKNIPGSHVIIRKKQGDIPDTTLLQAAMIAAYRSKAKYSSNVPVDYTFVKNVKKPSGSKPGMVIYDNYKTIYVTPDENILKKKGWL